MVNIFDLYKYASVGKGNNNKRCWEGSKDVEEKILFVRDIPHEMLHTASCWSGRKELVIGVSGIEVDTVKIL